jgi:ATP synthase protein I
MNNIDDKITKLKEKIEVIEDKKLSELSKKKESGAGFAFKISTELIAALVVGVGMGLIVDNFLGTKPFGLIIFFILGSFAGFLNIYRVMRRIEKQQNIN